jgi:hypothetical protein
MRSALWVFLLLGLALSNGFSRTSAAVLAQSGTTLSVTPAASEVIRTNTRTVILYVSAAVNLNAFDVTVTYDPALLTLVSWTHGGFLSNMANVLVTNTPGSLRVVATQLARPGVSGDGPLLNLVFRGTANGISPVTITAAAFSNPQGNTSYPLRQNGTLRVHDDPAPIPSFTVSGTLTLQGRPDSGGISVSLGYGALHWLGPYSATSTNLPADNLSLPGVYADSYLVTASMPRYLNLTAGSNKRKTVAAGSTSIAPLRLMGGNAVWQDFSGGAWVPNNVIDAADVSLVGSQYGQSGAGLDGDVNYSGTVDLLDLALVGGNFDLTSEQAYQNWNP